MTVAVQTQNKKGAAVEVKQIAKFYKETKALNFVDINIKAGEFLTLLGPSGSGKTTLLMSIAGFIEPTAGNIIVDEVDLVKIPPYKRNIGMVFQDYALFPHMTVFENIAFPLKMRKYSSSKIKEKVYEALSLVKLDNFSDRKISQLSGGQKQRVALARAIVYNPPLLLMDEPLGALDRKLREHMQIEIMRLKRTLGMTIIYVTHDQSEALVMSDRIAILKDGEILQIDTPVNIYKKPTNVFVADFLGESNFIEGIYSGEKDGEYGVVKFSDQSYIKGITRVDIARGENVKCAIRPEHLYILDMNNEEENTFQGEIEEIIYLGECTKYLIKLNQRVKIFAKIVNTNNTKTYNLGDKVVVKYNPESVLILKQQN